MSTVTSLFSDRLKSGGGHTPLPRAACVALAVTMTVLAQTQPGSLVTSFEPRLSESRATERVWVWVAAEDTDGKLTIGGQFDHVNQLARTNLARLFSDGTIDPSFNPGLRLFGLTCLAVQGDGKVLVGRTARNTLVPLVLHDGPDILRLQSDGSPDPRFNGEVIDGESSVTSILPQEDGTILVRRVTGDGGANFLRLNSDGTFAAGVIPGNPFALRQSNGAELRLVVTNAITHGVTIRRYRDGSIDPTFSFAPAIFGPKFSRTVIMAVQPDDRILVSAIADGLPAISSIRRIHRDGSLDTSFSMAETDGGPIQAVLVLRSGEILIMGGFNKVNGVPRDGIAKLFGTAVDAPSIIAPAVALPNVSFSWPTMRGRNYIVEFKDQLNQPNWTQFTAVLGDGSVKSVSQAVRTGGQRFYRLRVE